MSKAVLAVAVVAVLAISSIGYIFYANQGGSDDEMIVVTDMLGENVEVKKNPRHVACVSRTTYDLLVAFGVGDYIDGAYKTLFDNEWTSVLYPDSSKHFAYEYEPSYELLLERGVDVVFCPEKHITDGMREHGLAALNVSLYGNPNFEPYVYFLADLTEKLWPDVKGVSEKVSEWKQDFNDVTTKIESALKGEPTGERSLYYVRGDKDKGINYTDTGKSFNEYSFELLKMDYLGNKMGTTKPSTEAILSADPDVVVFGGIYQHKLKDVLLTDPIWENLSAVESGSVYNIGIGFSPMEQMGVFSPVFLADMANKLYPDIFVFDTQEMLKEMCQKYFGVKLTDDQAEYIMNGLGPDGEPMA